MVRVGRGWNIHNCICGWVGMCLSVCMYVCMYVCISFTDTSSLSSTHGHFILLSAYMYRGEEREGERVEEGPSSLLLVLFLSLLLCGPNLSGPGSLRAPSDMCMARALSHAPPRA